MVGGDSGPGSRREGVNEDDIDPEGRKALDQLIDAASRAATTEQWWHLETWLRAAVVTVQRLGLDEEAEVR
jgi:hypothetical protein